MFSSNEAPSTSSPQRWEPRVPGAVTHTRTAVSSALGLPTQRRAGGGYLSDQFLMQRASAAASILGSWPLTAAWRCQRFR